MVTKVNSEDVSETPSEEVITGTTYHSLYMQVLSNLPEEYKLLSMSDEDIAWTLHFTLKPAIASFHICKQDLNDRDEENGRFNFELTNDEFIILTNYMTIQYIDSNYIRVPHALELSLTSKDFNVFSPARHLEAVKALREMFVDETEALVMKYSLRQKIKNLKENKGASNNINTNTKPTTKPEDKPIVKPEDKPDGPCDDCDCGYASDEDIKDIFDECECGCDYATSAEVLDMFYEDLIPGVPDDTPSDDNEDCDCESASDDDIRSLFG